MYFFRTVILVLMIAVLSLTGYHYLKEKGLLNNQKNFLLYLLIIQLLLFIFNTNILFIIFIDIPCLLSYALNRKKEAVILSLFSVLYFIIFINLPITYYLIYAGYFLINLIPKKKINILRYQIIFKSFYTSFLYFIYFRQDPILIIYIIFIMIYLYLILELILYFMTKKEDSNNQLVYKMAHEIKNPLTICKGYMDMFDVNNKDKVERYIPIIKSEINRTLTILNDFLSLKRVTIQKDMMDLYMLLDDTNNTMSSFLKEKKIKLKIVESENDILINGDYERLKQVIINILKNSCEANAKKIEIKLEVVKNMAIITIVDDGDGISSSDLKKIGNLFYTTKSRGTGIGVNLSKEIIEQHSGKIEYKSELGKWTSVTILLPCITK